MDPTQSRYRWKQRVLPTAVLAMTTVILGTALRLEASPTGIGTHQQLGLPPCGVLIGTGLPCATCGMTTAFTHAVHGRLWAAFVTQPAGMVLAISTAVVSIVATWALIFAVPITPIAKYLWQPTTIWVLMGLVIVSWLYKCLVLYF